MGLKSAFLWSARQTVVAQALDCQLAAPVALIFTLRHFLLSPPWAPQRLPETQFTLPAPVYSDVQCYQRHGSFRHTMRTKPFSFSLRIPERVYHYGVAADGLTQRLGGTCDLLPTTGYRNYVKYDATGHTHEGTNGGRTREREEEHYVVG